MKKALCLYFLVPILLSVSSTNSQATSQQKLLFEKQKELCLSDTTLASEKADYNLITFSNYSDYEFIGRVGKEACYGGRYYSFVGISEGEEQSYNGIAGSVKGADYVFTYILNSPILDDTVVATNAGTSSGFSVEETTEVNFNIGAKISAEAEIGADFFSFSAKTKISSYVEKVFGTGVGSACGLSLSTVTYPTNKYFFLHQSKETYYFLTTCCKVNLIHGFNWGFYCSKEYKYFAFITKNITVTKYYLEVR